MRITEVSLKNFKRFTDLQIKGIPESAKLVLVVGPNGCGKSSLFDAFIQWFRWKTQFGFDTEVAYYRKNVEDAFEWERIVDIRLAGNEEPQRGSLYVRTAYRHEADFSVHGIANLPSPTEQVRIPRVIYADATVSENYQRLVYQTMSAVYDDANDLKTVVQMREELIGQVRSSMKAVFGDLTLNNIADPLGSGSFYFAKGSSSRYHYKNLSGGEKAAFDLLLDVHLKKRFYSDAIYCIDEMETHLHTSVQGKLLNELLRIVPEPSQLWMTTHSLGVLRAAQEMQATDVGSVCVIDFDLVNPDEPREIMPSSLNRVTWEKMLSIALDDLSTKVAPNVLVVCEGTSIGTRRKDFDAEIYNRVLGSQFPGILFISGGGSNQVAATGVSIKETMAEILPNTRIIALCDRDDKSDLEVSNFERAGGIVLPRRNLESYLFADDVLKALIVREGRQDLLGEISAIVSDATAASAARGNAPDDLKSAAGSIYVELKKILRLTRCGNNTDAFMRDTLAPLVKPGMSSFEDLKRAIIDRVN
ncbi:AAA family ATPase [Bradyrhizobium diazoefficiens]|nr:AAA family ATPase [Bradyrhizobium diazoefficiens]MBR0925733.1 AAA family ATPase [Bradyrhizobium diazoefficiens]